ncbi:FIST signal transduction protein [Orenia marismortui]|uniref:FIST signal transduction protein n=1 Tax=Orenia marismortui TaxID=46469 RepID=UPI0003707EA0|nr:FIST N-terminal domain-containing protein [Orenia marismortui]
MFKIYQLKGNEQSIIKKLKDESIINPDLIIFFASSKAFDFNLLNKELSKGFPTTQLLGCTTSGEISYTGFTNNSLVALVFNSIENFSTTVIPNVSKTPILHYDKIEKAITESEMSRTGEKGFIIQLITGHNAGEEKALSVVESRFENPPNLIGGSAGDDLAFETTYVSRNGKVYDDAAVFAFINNNNFKIYKENIFEDSNNIMQVTKVDVEKRVVYEFDGIAATKRYADLLGIKEAELEKKMFLNPLGRIIGNDLFISSPKAINNDGSISFYSRIYNKIHVSILKAANPLTILDKSKAQINQDFKKIDGMICINCILRTLQFKEEKITNTYTQSLGELTKNFGGFTSYGEQIANLHLNQTLALLVTGTLKK